MVSREFAFAAFPTIGTAMPLGFLNKRPLLRRQVYHRGLFLACPTALVLFTHFCRIGFMPRSANFGYRRFVRISIALFVAAEWLRIGLSSLALPGISPLAQDGFVCQSICMPLRLRRSGARSGQLTGFTDRAAMQRITPAGNQRKDIIGLENLTFITDLWAVIRHPILASWTHSNPRKLRRVDGGTASARIQRCRGFMRPV